MTRVQHSYNCPLSAIDRRLEDVHKQWHQAEEAYFEPESFRVSIQTAIQTLRTVTFIVQNHKDIIPDFVPWYGGWQERLRSDKLMRWMVDARNKIEKQGDLETHSFVRAEIVASYLEEGPAVELPADLFDAPWKMIKNIPDGLVGEHIRAHGTLRIQRRWVENSLPDYELLDAVSIAYGRVSQLVQDAHHQIGLRGPTIVSTDSGRQFGDRASDGRLPCMIGHAEARILNINLVDGRPMQIEAGSIELDRKVADESIERYGIKPGSLIQSDNPSEEGLLEDLFRTARAMFVADGTHVSIIFMIKKNKIVNIASIAPEEHGHKYIIMRTIANEVAKYDADAVISINEVWTGKADPSNPYRRVADLPDRGESLVATLISRAGTPIQMFATITRNEDSACLGDSEIIRDAVLFAFAPIYEVWGRPIPDHWVAAVRRMHATFDSQDSH